MRKQADEQIGVYWSFALWTVALGAVLMAAPDNWFGPSWSYFSQLPHNGFAMGVCCAGLGGLQALTLLQHACGRDLAYRVLAWLFFLAGFVYWTAGIILGAEGLLGHQGLMEAPFMLYAAAHQFSYSAALLTHARRKTDLDRWLSDEHEH